MNLNIEKAKEQDANIVYDLLVALYEELGEESESIPLINTDIVRSLLVSDKMEIFLARHDENEVLGVMTLSECQSFYAGGNYGILDEMYIRPEYRSKGIGISFMNLVKNIAKEKKWSRIEVTGPIEEKWGRTINFYEQCGFCYTGPKMKFVL